MCRVLPLIGVSRHFERGTATSVQKQRWPWQHKPVTACSLCGASQLLRGSVGDGCSEWLFLSCTHTCTRSKSAAVFESGRVVRRKDVMVFETKIGVHLQCFFYNFLFWFALEVGTGWIYGLLRRSCLNSRMLFTGRNELLLVFFFFLFSYCGYSM